MQISVTLSPEQILQVSKDMQAAMPAIVTDLAPTIIKRLLTEEGEREEREAFASKLHPGMESYARQRAKEGYTTFRQSVMLAMLPEMREAIQKHPELVQVAQVMALYLIENKKEVMAEGLERFLMGLWSNHGLMGQEQRRLSDGLLMVLRDKSLLNEMDLQRLRDFSRVQ